MTEKIAIIAWGAMADVLYATPIVRHIRSLHPQAEISWLVRDKFAEVLKTNPHIDHVEEFGLPPGYESRQDAEYIMDQSIVEFAARMYDKVYDLQYWPRHSNFYENPHEDFISLRARNAGLDPAAIVDRSVVLSCTLEDESAGDDLVRDALGKHRGLPFIAVNHISYAATPVWSFDNYSRLVDILDHEYGVLSIFTGAPNEPIPEHAFDARGTPYRVWADIIRQSRLWLGLDSGAVALACASDVPIIKLHSPDFPLAKTGIKTMGLRQDKVLELCPSPNPESLAQMIVENMR